MITPVKTTREVKVTTRETYSYGSVEFFVQHNHEMTSNGYKLDGVKGNSATYSKESTE